VDGGQTVSLMFVNTRPVIAGWAVIRQELENPNAYNAQ
jgi:hypothetical protein